MKDKVFGNSVNVASTTPVKFVNNIFSCNWFRAFCMETSYTGNVPIFHCGKREKYGLVSSTIPLTPSVLRMFW